MGNLKSGISLYIIHEGIILPWKYFMLVVKAAAGFGGDITGTGVRKKYMFSVKVSPCCKGTLIRRRLLSVLILVSLDKLHYQLQSSSPGIKVHFRRSVLTACRTIQIFFHLGFYDHSRLFHSKMQIHAFLEQRSKAIHWTFHVIV